MAGVSSAPVNLVSLAVVMSGRLVVAIAAIIAAARALAAPASFPGTVTYITDPTSRFQIRWAEPDGSSPHRLLFADVGSSGGAPFLKFDRSVLVVWAPNGKAFAVTNRTGSDTSEVLVFGVPPAQPNRLLPVFPARVRKLVETNHHAYLDVVTWDREGLTIHAHGYGDASSNTFSVQVHCNQRHEGWYCH
jgi:hypothetical protein